MAAQCPLANSADRSLFKAKLPHHPSAFRPVFPPKDQTLPKLCHARTRSPAALSTAFRALSIVGKKPSVWNEPPASLTCVPSNANQPRSARTMWPRCLSPSARAQILPESDQRGPPAFGSCLIVILPLLLLGAQKTVDIGSEKPIFRRSTPTRHFEYAAGWTTPCLWHRPLPQ